LLHLARDPCGLWFLKENGDYRGSIDDHRLSDLARKTVLIVADDFVGRAGVEDGQSCALLPDFHHSLRERTAAILITFELFSKSVFYSLCQRLTLATSQFRRQSVS